MNVKPVNESLQVFSCPILAGKTRFNKFNGESFELQLPNFNIPEPSLKIPILQRNLAFGSFSEFRIFG